MDAVTEFRADLTLPQRTEPVRLDRALSELFTDVSRAQITKWIHSGSILVNGEVPKPSMRVAGGEQVQVRAQREPSADWNEAQEIAFEIVHEDDDVLVIDKPKDLVVHPGAGHPNGTLVNGLLFHRPRQEDLPRAGVVHRLDKDTTGLMVVAKTSLAQDRLAAALARHEVDRRYVAVVEGVITSPQTIDLAIGRHPSQRTRQAVVATGRPATTHVAPLEVFRAHTSIAVGLETGRTHQIRVHLSAVDHPLVGDPTYGSRGRLPSLPTDRLRKVIGSFDRPALHSNRLRFTHPRSGRQLKFRSELPQDMRVLIDALRDDFSPKPNSEG